MSDERDHVCLTLQDLAEALGLDGEIIRIRMEDETDWVHLLIDGGRFATKVPHGMFPEIREWSGMHCQVMADGAKAWVGDDGKTRVVK
jgi:uncharacterized protein YPO0396